MYEWIMTVSFILSLYVGVQLRHELQWRLRHSRRQWWLQHEHQRHHHLHQTAQKCVSQPVGVYPNLLDPSSCGIPHRLPYFLMQVTFAHTFVHTYTYTLILPYLHVHTYILHIHTHTHLYFHIFMYIHTYIHTHIHTLAQKRRYIHHRYRTYSTSEGGPFRTRQSPWGVRTFIVPSI